MLASAFLVAAILFPAAGPTDAQPPGADGYFLIPGRTSTLRWKTLPAASIGPMEYQVRDYWDRPVTTGRVESGPQGAIETRISPSQGYCEVDFPAIHRRYGLVALPAHEGRADPFFAIDSALSWLVRRDDVREGLIRALRRSGVSMSRERLNWGAVNPSRDRWDWQTVRHYDSVRETYAQQAIPVLEMFHDRAPWSGGIERYPDDLVGLASAWQNIMARWRGTWGALEVWNEPDISFGGFLPADQYVPLVKTIAYAEATRSRSGKTPEAAALPIVGGVFARYNRRFLDNAAENGLLNCVDAISFHTYGRAMEMEKLVSVYRDWLTAQGAGAMPLWITECGRPWRWGPDRPPLAQDMESALDIAMKGVEARACGIARYFSFVYPFYEERESNFGMMDRQATPLRSMAAYAQLIRALSGKAYLGDLRCDDPAIRRARVFGDEGQTVAVLYTGRPEANATARCDINGLRLEGIDGRALDPTGSARVPIPDGLTYAWLDRAGLGDRLLIETRAMELWKTGQEHFRRSGAPSPIVLRFQFETSGMTATSDGYRIPAERSQQQLLVRVFNLAHQPHELSLKMTVETRAGAAISDHRTTVRVPGQAWADIAWNADLQQAIADNTDLRLRVTAASPALDHIAPLVVDLAGEPSLAQLLGRYPEKTRLPIEENARWRPSISSRGRMTVASLPDGSCRLSATFGPGDRWVYPRFLLPDGMDLSKAEALVLRARCEVPSTARAFLWEDRVGYMTAGSMVPADGRWHAVLVPFRDLVLATATGTDPDSRLDLDQVHRISIGMNTKAAQAVLDFADVYVVGQGK